MIKLIISSQLHGVRDRDFTTQQELNEQVALWDSTKHWGEPVPYWVTASKDLEGNVTVPVEALETRVTEVPATELNEAYSYTEFLMPATVTYSTQDVTQETNDAKEDSKRLARIAWADKLFAQLARENAKDIASGTNTLANVVAAEAKLQPVQTTMQSSSFELALLKYQALDLPELSASRKSEFIAKIQAYLAAEI